MSRGVMMGWGRGASGDEDEDILREICLAFLSPFTLNIATRSSFEAKSPQRKVIEMSKGCEDESRDFFLG